MDRLLINICSTNLAASKDFYAGLFDFNVDFDSDWFVHLVSQNKNLELGIIDAKSDVVPPGLNSAAEGFYLTMVIDNVDDFFERNRDELDVIEPPTDTFYGQRRLLIKDPNGVVIDVSSLIPS